MRKTFTAILCSLSLAACSSPETSRKYGAADYASLEKNAVGATPAFALPGVPLKEDLPAAPAADKISADPAEAAPAAAAAGPAGDLAYHLSSARKYSAGKKYRSAAAEYGAALGFLPAGDARAVGLLERQGAMLLKAGNEPKAQEYFLSAVEKAKELKSSGKDLAASYLGLGYCQERAKKVQDAISSYEKALELTGGKKTREKIAETIRGLKVAPK